MIKFRGALNRLVASVLLAIVSTSCGPVTSLAAAAKSATIPEASTPATNPGNAGREITPERWDRAVISTALLNLYVNLQMTVFRLRFLSKVRSYGGTGTGLTVTRNVTAVTDRIGSMAGWEDLSMSIVESGFFRLFYNDLGYSRRVSTSAAVALRQVVEYAINHPEWFD